MNARDLRIGNIVFDKIRSEHDFEKLGNGIYRVSSHAIERFDAGFMDLKPVPLTSEWLYRLGLYWDIYWQGITDGNWVLTEGNENGTWRIAYGKTRHDIIVWNIKYVHQLQNLYQCLSGKELQLKD